MVQNNEVFVFYKENGNLPFSNFIKLFKEKFTSFTDCKDRLLYTKITRLNNRILALNKNKKKKGNVEKRFKLLAEDFVIGDTQGNGDERNLEVLGSDDGETGEMPGVSGVRSSIVTAENESVFDPNRQQMTRDELLQYVLELERENRDIRERGAHGLRQSEDVINSYDRALENLRELAGDAEKNYNQILKWQGVGDRENEKALEGLKREMEELEVKYDRQQEKVKDLEKLMKFYKDENTYLRDWRNRKKIKELRGKLKDSLSAEESLKGRVDTLLIEQDTILAELEEEREKLSNVLKEKRYFWIHE